MGKLTFNRFDIIFLLAPLYMYSYPNQLLSPFSIMYVTVKEKKLYIAFTFIYVKNYFLLQATVNDAMIIVLRAGALYTHG